MKTELLHERKTGLRLLLPCAVLGFALQAEAAAPTAAVSGTAAPAPTAQAPAASKSAEAAPAVKPKEDLGKKLFPDLGPGGDIEITSDSMDMDFSKHISTFTGNVVVTDPRMTLKADRMVVQFDVQEKPQHIEAAGNVVIDQPVADRHAKAGKAEYDVVKGVVVLTEKPSVTAGGNTMSGAARITYYRDEERVTADGGTEPGTKPVIHVTPPKDGQDSSNTLNPKKKTEKNDK